MNVQNTPVHIKLWHRDFWLLSFASLLLTVAVYVLIPVMPKWLMDVEHFTPAQTGRAMGVFGLGLYVFGALCSWLVQQYRRNVVCMWAIIFVALDVALLWYMDAQRTISVDFTIVMLQRFLLGAAFGLAQMVLASTLIIDTCESFQRTEANHSVSWFTRFALSLGPLAGLLLYECYGFNGVMLASVGCAVGAFLLVNWWPFPSVRQKRVFMWLRSTVSICPMGLSCLLTSCWSALWWASC